MTRNGPGSGTWRTASFRRMPPTALVPPPLAGLSRSSASTRDQPRSLAPRHERVEDPQSAALERRAAGSRERQRARGCTGRFEPERLAFRQLTGLGNVGVNAEAVVRVGVDR